MIGIALAAVSGMAFVAYRHPSEYRRLAFIVAGAAGMVFLQVAMWQMLDISINASTLAHIAKEIPESTLESQRDQITEIHSSLRQLAFSAIVALGVLGYLAFLLQLPKLGISHRESRGPDPPSDESERSGR